MSDDRPDAVTAVIREAGFRRLSADATFFAFLGRDLEAAIITYTNDIVGVSDADGMPERFADIVSEPRYVEAARVRMSPLTAFTALQNLYLVLRTHGLVDEAAMRAALNEAERIVAERAEAAEATNVG